MLNTKGKNGHSCFVPDCGGNPFSLFPLSIMLTEGFSQVHVIQWRKFPYSLNLVSFLFVCLFFVLVLVFLQSKQVFVLVFIEQPFFQVQIVPINFIFSLKICILFSVYRTLPHLPLGSLCPLIFFHILISQT